MSASLDVVPFVYLDEGQRGAACAAALMVADRIAWSSGCRCSSTASSATGATAHPCQLRRGGVDGLAARIASGELAPDFGPQSCSDGGRRSSRRGPPLVAFNLQLAPPATLEDARRVAAAVREGGEHGLPGLRAIGVVLAGQQAQVSMNVERPNEARSREVVAADLAAGRRASAEMVGLVPRAALEGFPLAAHRALTRPPGDRERTRLLLMAQVEKKRQTKHRGNAAGMVESRGRTGRKPTSAEKKGAKTSETRAKSAPIDRRNKPPSWRRAFIAAMFAAVLLFVIMSVLFKKPTQGIASSSPSSC